MVLKVQKNANDVQVYTVSGAGSKSIPDWLARKNRKTLRNDADYKSRIELLQDFEFPEASNKIRLSPDGEYAMATGTYKPHIRLYEFSQMSMKFERHTNAENVTFEILSDNWTKSVHLQADRSIDLHTAGGIHYSTRIPTFGRDIRYHYPTADLLIGASTNEVFRLNLDQGRFLNALDVETATNGVNTVDICPAHQLFGFGTANGTVEFWDPRFRSRIGLLDMNSQNESASITALKFADDGLNFAVGSDTGITTLFDLRSPQPILSKDQGYGLPIKSLHYLQSPASDPAHRILSADSKIIKIWDARNGTPHTSVEPPNDINDVQPVQGSGLIFVANEGIPMHTFYIPSLGAAPRWCSFLDNLTEELEETETSVYANYKFVSRKELADLGLKHLVGTNVVRTYMHGFFIDFRLYEKAKLIANPFEYAEHRQRQIASKIEKERESRIRSAKKTKINNTLASRLQKTEDRARAKGEEIQTSVVEDNRFKDAFNDEDFKIDEKSHEFNILNPTRSKTRGLTAAEESEEDRENLESSSGSESESESEREEPSKPTKGDDDQIRTVRVREPKKKAPKMRAVRQDPTLSTHNPTISKQSQSFGSRLSTQSIRDARQRQIAENIKSDVAGKGTKEMTFVPERKKRENTREGKVKQEYAGRRSASGNVFRKFNRGSN
ncbi:rRNA processing protein Enp2 [Taphrina deformans PYCC 5710]|uniref:rRNA processing protein Enp2 n=1 Tax=Taphrina deformans (strain PYCC 5710 / ATCC 11124 / CBS 356.35 / IMI 108563 / JCM 9778 / NBRC 8474) TaxID=1097556 RepID=S0BE40_TAPDE|nr:rRNA processing protein Enp2 [Taphrina deformans PYCC 5710]|eukprot:CCG81554.1 rRNA processing protein Enp2 [Taphrina deformans PYCC 5710]